MSELLRMNEEYRNWIEELSQRYRASQIKASVRVNNEMLMYYWSVGRDISERHADSKWGNKFFQTMSMDLTDMIPNVKGFSPSNLRYMMRFYNLFKEVEIVPQLEEQFQSGVQAAILPQLDAKLTNVPHGEIVHQTEEQFGMASNRVFMIPWGHIKLLIDKCHANPAKFNFYVDKAHL